nr:homeobox protein 2-like [Aedes albopictus]
MVNPGSRRGSNSSCRKTVSFDIITDNGNAADDGVDEIHHRLNNNSSYSSNHYHYQRRPSTNEVAASTDDEDDDDLVDAPRWQPSRGTKKSPSEPIFKFCKVKSTSNRSVNSASNNPNSNTKSSNNNNEYEGDDVGQDPDIDSGSVHRRSSMAQVEAIRDYVSRNYDSPARLSNNNNDDNGEWIGTARLLKDDGNDFGDRRQSPLFSNIISNSSTTKGKLLASVESCFMTDMH